MASKLPTVNIPVSVDSRDVDAGVRHIEHKMAGLKRKLERMKPAGGGGPTPKAAQATAFLGSVGRLGPASGMLGAMGGAGLAMAAPMALAGMARQHVEAMAQLTKGATDALEQFRLTGEQTFAVNSSILSLLAQNERAAAAAAAVPGPLEAARIASMARVEQGGPGTLERLSTALSQFGAFAGAWMSGKGVRESIVSATQATTTDERIAAALEGQLKAMEQARMAGDVSALDLTLGSLNLKLEQLGVAIGRMGL